MKKFFVTTPIFYVNAFPHLGHAYADLIADVLARYHRIRGEKTFFLTGTDEHGAKIVRAAEKAGKPVEDFVHARREDFRNLLTLLNASHDAFIYTTDKEHHWPGVRKVWEKLVANGDLYKSVYKGLYCVGHEAFVTEKDLVNGVCEDHHQKPELIEEENYFFRLSKYIPQIQKAIESDEFKILPVERKNEVLAFIGEGVEDISFSRPSRDISWGIPVPNDPDHTIYVWADALTNYISALGYGSSDEKNVAAFWPADAHIVGKDILRFHAVIWPGILYAVGLPLPKMLYVHGMILSRGQKMSKTIGNVIDPVEVIKEYGNDAFRYFLMREIPFGKDGDFTMERFKAVYEGSLAHGLGNLVARVAVMIQKYAAGVLDRPAEEALLSVPTKRSLHQEVSKSRFLLEGESLERYFQYEVFVRYEKAMDDFLLTDAIAILWDFFSLLDGYIQDYEPYTLNKKDPEKTKLVLWNLAIHLIRIAIPLEPFMPQTTEKIYATFGVKRGDMNPKRIEIGFREILFPSHEVRAH